MDRLTVRHLLPRYAILIALALRQELHEVGNRRLEPNAPTGLDPVAAANAAALRIVTDELGQLTTCINAAEYPAPSP